MARGARPSVEVRAAIVKAYRDGATFESAAAPWGLSRTATLTALREAGESPRTRGRRTLSVREDFFDSIDTEAKAYWLGFLAADGFVGQRGVVLILKGDDRDHVVAFREALGAGHAVTMTNREAFGKVFPQVRCKVTSVRLQRALEARGVGKASRWQVRPWAGVPSDLARHFWRGMVDGDGSIGFTAARGGPQASIHLCGFERDVSAFAEFLAPVTRSRAIPRCEPDRDLWTVHIGGNRVVPPAVRLLYEGATIALARKAAIARRILGG